MIVLQSQTWEPLIQLKTIIFWMGKLRLKEGRYFLQVLLMDDLSDRVLLIEVDHYLHPIYCLVCMISDKISHWFNNTKTLTISSPLHTVWDAHGLHSIIKHFVCLLCVKSCVGWYGEYLHRTAQTGLGLKCLWTWDAEKRRGRWDKATGAFDTLEKLLNCVNGEHLCLWVPQPTITDQCISDIYRLYTFL